MGSKPKHIKIGDEKLLHPDSFEQLPAHRALSYYRKRVAKLPGQYVYNCGCCDMRRSDISYDQEKEPEMYKRQRKMEDMFIKYKNTIKGILDEKDHVK